MARLDEVARVPLATLPTPLHLAPRLSERLGVEIWFKRDDLTGLGLGGNKVRGLEFLLADALAQGCDHLVTGRRPAEQLGDARRARRPHPRPRLDPRVLRRPARGGAVGNHALAELAGARLHFTGDSDRSSADRGVDEVCRRLRDDGAHAVRRASRRGHRARRPGLRAGHRRAGRPADGGRWCRPRQLWLATGSCGTQAGLVAGRGVAAGGVRRRRRHGEPAGRGVPGAGGDGSRRTRARLLDVDRAGLQVEVVDGFLGPAKGVRSPRATPPPSWWRAPRASSSTRSSRPRRWPGCWPRRRRRRGGGPGRLPGERRSPHPLHGLTATRDRSGCLLRRSRAGRA